MKIPPRLYHPLNDYKDECHLLAFSSIRSSIVVLCRPPPGFKGVSWNPKFCAAMLPAGGVMARTGNKKIMLAALATVGGCALLCSGVIGAWLAHRAARTSRDVEAYNTLSASVENRTYTRDPETPGWALEEGAAAPLYREAYDACGVGNIGDLHDPIIRTVHAQMPESWQPAKHVDLYEVGTRDLPAECVAAGVPAGYDDRVVSQLEPELCDLLVECRPALELVRRGTRMSDTRSPIDVWSAWALEAPGEPRGCYPYHILVRLELLDGHLAAIGEDRAERLASLFVVMRFWSDISNGTHWIVAKQGTQAQRRAGGVLQGIVLDPALAPADAETIYRELTYVLRHPVDLQQALEVAQLGSTFFYYPVDRLRIPPGAQSIDPSKVNPVETEILGQAVRDDLLPHWQRTQELLSMPYPQRLEGYERNEQLMQDAHPLAKITSSMSPRSWDSHITYTQAYMRLLQIATADALYCSRYSHPPQTLEALATEFDDLQILDPLTDEPYILESSESGRVLRSAALDGDRFLDLRLEHINKTQRIEDHLRLELPARDPTHAH